MKLLMMVSLMNVVFPLYWGSQNPIRELFLKKKRFSFPQTLHFIQNPRSIFQAEISERKEKKARHC